MKMILVMKIKTIVIFKSTAIGFIPPHYHIHTHLGFVGYVKFHLY